MAFVANNANVEKDKLPLTTHMFHVTGANICVEKIIHQMILFRFFHRLKLDFLKFEFI